jgi:hypothetical protein
MRHSLTAQGRKPCIMHPTLDNHALRNQAHIYHSRKQPWYRTPKLCNPDKGWPSKNINFIEPHICITIGGSLLLDSWLWTKGKQPTRARLTEFSKFSYSFQICSTRWIGARTAFWYALRTAVILCDSSCWATACLSHAPMSNQNLT